MIFAIIQDISTNKKMVNDIFILCNYNETSYLSIIKVYTFLIVQRKKLEEINILIIVNHIIYFMRWSLFFNYLLSFCIIF